MKPRIWLTREIEVEFSDQRFALVEIETCWENDGTLREPDPTCTEFWVKSASDEDGNEVTLTSDELKYVEEVYDDKYEDLDYEHACDDLYLYEDDE